MAENEAGVTAPTTVVKFEMPAVIQNGKDYERSYKYLVQNYHVLTPVTAFSGMAPHHGLVVAKVLIDSDPKHGEVYADPLFCNSKSDDVLDHEVAIAKVGLRKLALAGGWTLQADVVSVQRNYWMVRGNCRFVGLDGAVQAFSATEEYDLRDGSPQVRNMTPKQLDAARSHGLRGGEARALNAACREYGIRQKYTRRELQKAFVVMRMMFIPDASNDMQMRMVTERALQGTGAMFPQSQLRAPAYSLEPIDGMKEVIEAQIKADPAEPLPAVPENMTLIREVKVEERKRKPPKTGTFKKWTCIDMHGIETVTVKKEIGESLLACWNKEDWKKGRPLEIVAGPRNAYNESDIVDLHLAPVADAASSAEGEGGEDEDLPFGQEV